MKKTYLVFEDELKGYKKSSKLIFFDEYTQRLVKRKKIKFFKVESILKFEDIKNFNFNSKNLRKKISRYRKELTNIFNKIHDKKYDENYWGLILDRLLFLLINAILIELRTIKKIYPKKNIIEINELKFKSFFLDSDDFIRNYETNLTQPYIRYLICKNLGFKESLIKKITINKQISLIENKKFNFGSYFELFLRFCVRKYINIFKPFLIVDGYIPKKNCFILFLKSKGKILAIPNKYIFSKKNFKNTKKNFQLRKFFKVQEKDFIDKMFNLLFSKFMPASYLENYKKYNKEIDSLKSLKIVGTAISLIYNDHFKYLSAEINKNKGKIFNFQHGGLIGYLKYDHDVTINNKYSSKVFSWNEGKNFSENYFKKFKKINNAEIKAKRQLLIYPTRIKIKYNYNQCVNKNNHPYLNYNYSFYSGLEKKIKDETFIKTFPNEISKKSSEIWIEKFGKNINLIYEKKNDLFNKYRLVVLDDFSTPLCELLYIGTPFIIINDEMKRFKENIVQKLRKLKKLNILFSSPESAYKFLNKNYNNIPLWWRENIKSPIFKDVKKALIPTGREESILSLLDK